MVTMEFEAKSFNKMDEPINKGGEKQNMFVMLKL